MTKKNGRDAYQDYEEERIIGGKEHRYTGSWMSSKELFEDMAQNSSNDDKEILLDLLLRYHGWAS